MNDKTKLDLLYKEKIEYVMSNLQEKEEEFFNKFCSSSTNNIFYIIKEHIYNELRK